MRQGSVNIALAVAVLCLVMLVSAPAFAREVQLAGMRLGDHAINLLDIYGQPQGIVVGAGEELGTAGGATAGGMDMMGAGPAMPGGLGGLFDMPGAAPEMMMAPGADIAAPAAAGPGGFPEADMMGPEGMGMPGAGGAEAGGGTAAGGASPFPMWAQPVWITLESNDCEWIYQRGDVVVGFVLDRDGFIKAIAVAAAQCNFARTALWKPHRYVKLGDSFKQVLYRYGYPDEYVPFTASSTGSGTVTGGAPTVTFNQVSRSFSRDCQLRYTEESNIAFTLHNFAVTRVHIWE